MSDRVVPIVIVGARGRMGKTLIRTVMESESMTLVGAVERTGAPGMGEDAGRSVGLPEAGVPITDRLDPPRGSVVVDFSLPDATADNIRCCRDRGVALVLGTTGLNDDTRRLLRDASETIPIVSAANFSVGVTLLTRLAAIATRALGADWDVEIFEIHHRHKRDAPSGTALRLGKAIAAARGRELEDVVTRNRAAADAPRTPDEIGIFGLRGGDSVGEHTVLFMGAGERLELVHRATDRAIFARGALRAARWLADKKPGSYDLTAVLGLDALG